MQIDIFFWLAFLMGCIIVASTSADIFAKPSYARNPGKPYTRIKPRFITLRKKYNRTRVFYMGVIVGIYSVISFFDGILLFIVGNDSPLLELADSPIWPLAAVSCIVGVQSVPLIKKIEEWCRLKLHKWAKIPNGARDTIDMLRRAGFYFRHYENDADLTQQEFVNVNSDDFKEDRFSVENRWAKICCILYNLRMSRESEACSIGGFSLSCYDTDFFYEYEEEYEEITALHRNLSNSVARYKEMKIGAEQVNQENLKLLKESLEKDSSVLLERVYTFVACAVRSKQSTDSEVYSILGQLGFSLPSSQARPIDMEALIVFSGFTTALILLAVLAGSWIFPKLINENLINEATYMKGGAVLAFVWAICAVLSHGTAAWLALKYRKIKVSKLQWKVSQGSSPRPLRHYLISALAGGMAGYIVLLIVIFLTIALQYITGSVKLEELTRKFFLQNILNNLIWIVAFGCTGWFAVFHNDPDYRENQVPEYLKSIALQAATMAVVGFVCTLIFTEIWHHFNTRGNTAVFLPVRLLFSFFLAVILLIMGGFMGFWFPKCKYDSLFKRLRIDCVHDDIHLPTGAPIFEGDNKIGENGRWLKLYHRSYCLFVKCDELGEAKRSEKFDLDLEQLEDEIVAITVQPAI